MKIETLKDEIGETRAQFLLKNLSFTPAHWYGLATGFHQNYKVQKILLTTEVRHIIATVGGLVRLADQAHPTSYESVLVTDRELPDEILVLIKLSV